MDSFTLNKIAGAVLGTCLLGMGLGVIGDFIYAPSIPTKPGYPLPEPKPDAAGGASEKKAPDVPLPALLAKADPKRGETSAKVCGACHNFAEGAGAKVGPDLYGVVGRPKGSAAGFDYSAGMKAKGGNWEFADLNEFITKPSAYVQGTKMSYPGEDNAEKRADIIAYLRSLSKSPVALPAVADAKPADAPKPADAEAPKPADAGKPAEAPKQADAGKPAEAPKPADAGKPAEAPTPAEAPKPAEAAKPADAGGDDPFVKLVAAADPKKGQSAAQVCSACHNLKKGGGTLVGPELYGVVDRPKGSMPGFDYSAGMKAKGGNWTYADLNQFLTKPSAYVQGTKMGYPGEANEKKRADIVAFLRTLAESPAPLPGAK